MSDRLGLRRHLYEQLGRRPSRRARRALRRQILVVAGGVDGDGQAPGRGPDDGPAGVREPRRPRPSAGPAAQVLPLEVEQPGAPRAR